MLYNLVRTNPSLTGNVKLGCYLDNGKVTSVKFSPLSSQLPMMMSPIDENKMRNTTYGHELKNYYSVYSDSFFDFPIDERFTNEDDYLWNPDGVIENRITDCEVGMKRVSYKKNEKQFSFLMPVYIDNKDDIFEPDSNGTRLKKLVVTLIKKSYDMEPGSSKYMNPITIDLNGTAFGDFLINHFSNSEFDEKVINLKINEFDSTIHGLSAKTGQFAYTSDDIGMSLGTNEKLLMEFDSLICNTFQKYDMVMKQIINFCFYFNLEDLKLSRYNLQEIASSNKVDINIKFQGADWYDLDFNYTNIKKVQYEKSTEGKMYSTLSDKDLVNDYLKDDHVVESIYKNRLLPVINHWSLNTSNKYIVNLYNGYSPILDDTKTKTTSIYNDTPDIYSKEADITKFNKNWGKLYSLTSEEFNKISLIEDDAILDDSEKDILNLIISEASEKVVNKQCIFNGLKYDFTNSSYQDIKSLSIIQTAVLDVSSGTEFGLLKEIEVNNNLIIIYKSNTKTVNDNIYLESNTLPTIGELLDMDNTELVDRTIKDCLIPYDIYKLDIQLYYYNATPPFIQRKIKDLKQLKEVHIHKEKNQPVVLYRYFGWIKPTLNKLTSIYDDMYQTKGLYIDSSSVWSKKQKRFPGTSARSGYRGDVYVPMKYPSLGLYTLSKFNDDKRVYISSDKTTPLYSIILEDDKASSVLLTERKFFLNSYYYVLEPVVLISGLKKDDNARNEAWKYFKNRISVPQQFGIDSAGTGAGFSDTLDYIISLYDFEIDFDTNTEDYSRDNDTFKIKLTLK